MRAVVTEIRGTSAAVLCENGEVRLVPAQKYRVGQEITLTESRRRVLRPPRKAGHPPDTQCTTGIRRRTRVRLSVCL